MVFETTVLSFICLAGLIGNVSLFLIVYKDRHLQTVTNLFILNLSAADILVSLLSMPVTVVTIISERWVFGHTACTALGFFTLLSFIASVMSLGMIALNRYFYIVKWNTYTKTFSKKKALLYVAAVWFVPISLASPPLFGCAEYRFIPGKSYCFVYWPSNVYFMYFMITVCFFGPLSVMAFSYYNILVFTRDSNRRVGLSTGRIASSKPPDQTLKPTESNGTQNTHIPDLEEGHNMSEEPQLKGPNVSKLPFKLKSHILLEETKLTQTFIIVVVLFVMCWGPFAVTMFFDVYYPKPLPRAVEIISFLLGYLNSMCNPVLYGLRNLAFNHGFRGLYSRFIPERFWSTNFVQQENVKVETIDVSPPVNLETGNVIIVLECTTYNFMQCLFPDFSYICFRKIKS